MESFFALLQEDVLDRQPWATRDGLRITIVIWTERTYHRRRRQTGPSQMSMGSRARGLLEGRDVRAA